MNKPLQVNVTHTDQAEEPKGEQPSEETEPSDEIETDIMASVPATMKSRARQLIKKFKSNKDLIGWNEQGQMVFKLQRKIGS
jgi:ERCC4-type nuclease